MLLETYTQQTRTSILLLVRCVFVFDTVLVQPVSYCTQTPFSTRYETTWHSWLPYCEVFEILFIPVAKHEDVTGMHPGWIESKKSHQCQQWHFSWHPCQILPKHFMGKITNPIASWNHPRGKCLEAKWNRRIYRTILEELLLCTV